MTISINLTLIDLTTAFGKDQFFSKWAITPPCEQWKLSGAQLKV